MNTRVSHRLACLPAGTAAARRFELLTALIFKRAFCPTAIDRPLLQVATPHPEYRRDVILPVAAGSGQWHYWAVVYGSDLIMIECKNYAEPIGPTEVDMTAKYLRRPGLARLAFIATRKPPKAEAIETARDIYRADGKLFIFLANDELGELARLGGRGLEAEAYLRRQYQLQKMAL